jgi:hypothetical protein
LIIKLIQIKKDDKHTEASAFSVRVCGEAVAKRVRILLKEQAIRA